MGHTFVTAWTRDLRVI